MLLNIQTKERRISEENIPQGSRSVLPGPAKPSLPLQPKTTAFLAPSTATYHKCTFFMFLGHLMKVAVTAAPWQH
jgi:hypothetical protein